MDTQTHRSLWLDLEDTIITPVVSGWWNTDLINLQKIRAVIDEFKPSSINLFSFAIWNHDELNKFNQATRPMIEQALGTHIAHTPTVDDDIIPACCRALGINPGSVDFSEASDFWSKHQSFRLFCLDHFNNTWKNQSIETEVIFLDDAVFNESFEWPDLHVKGRILNINTLN
jgi:hypothetical protein